jgi:hypothetical protein
MLKLSENLLNNGIQTSAGNPTDLSEALLL